MVLSYSESNPTPEQSPDFIGAPSSSLVTQKAVVTTVEPV